MAKLRKNHQLTQSQIKDSAIVLVICLLITDKSIVPIPFALILISLFLILLKPSLYKPFASLWFSLSEIIGSVMQKIILTMIFYLVVCPIGFCLRLFSSSEMRLTRKEMEAKSCAFITRQHQYTISDIEKPF